MGSKTKLGNFLITPLARLNDDADCEYFRKCGYLDYRVGCAICERGEATSFRTNFFEIAKKNEPFSLDELDIVLDRDSDCCKHDYELPIYHLTTDRDTIQFLFEMFKSFHRLSLCKLGTNPKYNILDGHRCGWGITSVFRSSRTRSL